MIIEKSPTLNVGGINWTKGWKAQKLDCDLKNSEKITKEIIVQFFQPVTYFIVRADVGCC